MPAVRTGYSCPLCKRKSGDTNEVVADGGRLHCSKVTEHQWPGMDEFYDLRPTIDFKQEQQRPVSQPGHIEVTVKVPLSVKNALMAKYGDKADGIVAGILVMMAEGECLVVRETDLARIATVLPQKLKDSSHLFGLIMAQKFELDEAKQTADAAVKDVKAYEGMSVGRVLVDLGDQYSTAVDRARGEELPVKLACEKWLRDGLANNWF